MVRCLPPPSACHATVTHRENPTLTLTLTLALNTNPNPSPSPSPSPDQVKYLEITNALKTVDGGEGGARDGQVPTGLGWRWRRA